MFAKNRPRRYRRRASACRMPGSRVVLRPRNRARTRRSSDFGGLPPRQAHGRLTPAGSGRSRESGPCGASRSRARRGATALGGWVAPSALAVFRLTTRSNVVGSSIGSSPGRAPLRILSTYAATRCAASRRPDPYDRGRTPRRNRGSRTLRATDASAPAASSPFEALAPSAGRLYEIPVICVRRVPGSRRSRTRWNRPCRR